MVPLKRQVSNLVSYSISAERQVLGSPPSRIPLPLTGDATAAVET